MNVKKPIIGLLLLLYYTTTTAQDLTGRWEGYLNQDGLADTFLYQINIEQDGKGVSGTSTSKTKDGSNGAKFLVSGLWENKRLILQELQQLEPNAPLWCLKFAELEYSAEPGQHILSGRWKATDCTPGDIYLWKKATFKKSTIVDTFTRMIPPTITGKWTGTLSQSDRDYGFYFEVDLNEGDVGQSYIVSEDNGGSATHALKWEMVDNEISFRERDIIKKSDGNWRWCIKSAILKFNREEAKLTLEGDWEGYIEGYSMSTGSCANGRLYLEKPILTETIVKEKQVAVDLYEKEYKRTVKIARVLEVSQPNIKIKVWDNGTVDGDIVTLFLNGDRILYKQRVTKRKLGIPVTLTRESNFLILHAEDLGDISPNTVAVSVDDGVEEQIIILSSNLEESGAVLIREFKVN